LDLDIIKRVDLQEYIDSFLSYFSREKPIFIEGDVNIHSKLIKELSSVDFTPPLKVKNLDRELVVLKKQGRVRIDEVYEFTKIISYFKYLKKLKFENRVLEWLDKIIIPTEIDEILDIFDKNGDIKDNQYEELDRVKLSLKKNQELIRTSLHKIMNNQKLSTYLVDRSVHYLNDEEAILVRGGFNHVIKGSVIGRSSAGFFYIIPDSIKDLKDKEAKFLSHKEEILYKISKELSKLFNKYLPFLKYINSEFDRFDHYQARVLFAKNYDLNFILPSKDRVVILKDFYHPALKDAKPINIDFSKSILMLTGVNAGGKTMVLKSILSSVFMSKYLIPMKISPKSKIGSFKDIFAILDDPQSVKNDISTFAGRMVEFSKIFHKRSIILGVDEIELGTDSDEAASLFKVMLEELIKKDIKIVITTHHKRLAALLSHRDDVELVAALYDEDRQLPTYEFLQGTIGKSYAFETASRYGIPYSIIKSAKIVYGEDRDRLNELIERSSALERELKFKINKLDSELDEVARLKLSLKDDRERAKNELDKKLNSLTNEYQNAINSAKKAAKESDLSSIHRLMNQANRSKQELNKSLQTTQDKPIEFKKGDRVKYRNSKGVILSLKSNEAYIETDDGMKMRVKKSDLKRSGNYIKPKPKVVKTSIEKPKMGTVKLDLHGLRSDEAQDRLDKFISDSLISGFDELLVYHGIGTGKLSYAVKEFLKHHPKVKGFEDAPASMGGFGAKIVYL
jgi:DNA mismatch repair protein MutS2